jgi:hypothetical protein
MSHHQPPSSTNFAHLTISEAVEAYSTQRRSQDPTADSLLTIIKSRLRTEPVSELDVQTVWWTRSFCTPEWIEALFYNIVKFDVFNSQPAGGYIELFIETEMLEYHGRACNNIVAMYQRQMSVVVAEAAEREAACKAEPGYLRRTMIRVADKGVQVIKEVCISKVMFDYLKTM